VAGRFRRFAARIGLTNLVDVHDPRDVTRVGTEVDPRDSGLDRDTIESIWTAVERYYHLGLQPALGLTIRHRGAIVLDRTIGHARGNGPGEDGIDKVVATPRTLFGLASGSKVVTAMAIHLLAERGELDLDAPISEYVDALAATDKREITTRQLLSHRAGMPAVPPEHVDLTLLTNPVGIVRAVAAAPRDSLPGRATAYHALSGGFVLGEVLRSITGVDVRAFVRREITGPAGIEDLDYGVPEARLHEVAVDSFTGPTPIPGLAGQLERSIGVPVSKVVDLMNDPRFRMGIIPSGNVVATGRSATAFFELLRNRGQLDGRRIFDPRTVDLAVSDTGYRGLDKILLLPIRYGFGFMLGNETISFFGARTPRAFGHLGFTNVLVWADPDREISVALLNNGKPFVTPELVSWLKIPYEIARRIPHAR
jgi:CubicO group peptidase (beta-lactamase class C family)